MMRVSLLHQLRVLHVWERVGMRLVVLMGVSVRMVGGARAGAVGADHSGGEGRGSGWRGLLSRQQ